MALEEVSNAPFSDTGISVRGTTMPGTGRTGFNKDVLGARTHKTSPSSVQEVISPSVGSDASLSGKNGMAQPNFGIFQYPSTEREIPREIKLQEWEGQVQEVGRDYFSARLVDLTLGEKEETEEAELPLDDLTESDRALLVPGAVFRWIIGYRYVHGQKERFTRVVIRRLPMWTNQEIKAADKNNH